MSKPKSRSPQSDADEINAAVERNDARLAAARVVAPEVAAPASGAPAVAIASPAEASDAPRALMIEGVVAALPASLRKRLRVF